MTPEQKKNPGRSDVPRDPRTRPIPSQGADKFMVRFPGSMREQISRLANQNRRSMNSEIVARLENSLSREREDELQEADEPMQASDIQVFKRELSPFEVRLVIFFRRLPGSKRKAMLELFS